MTPEEALAKLPACPVEVTLSLVGNKWQLVIVRRLLVRGTMRFRELQRSMGKISQKVLTQNLRAMEATGLVHRGVFAEVPLRVEYSLTDMGKSLEPVVDALYDWGEAYKAKLAAGEVVLKES